MGMHNSNDESMALLLSIGTGEATAKPWPRGKLAQAKYHLKVMFSGTLDLESADRELGLLSNMKFPYVRFNVQKDLKSKIKLDDWKPAKGGKSSTQEFMTEPTKEYLAEGTCGVDEVPVEKKLREVAKMLVESRRKRAATPRWHMAIGLRYHCTVKKCHNGQKVRNTRGDLIRHMDAVHSDLSPGERSSHTQNGTLRR
ncbi:MAG: hypothetical protein MMC23_000645 [Stictis urceolatum]|nr:hypothetical protein [Stictis urceolata]